MDSKLDGQDAKKDATMETLHILDNSKREIVALREQNARLNERVQIYDDMVNLFKGGPTRTGYELHSNYDLVDRIEKKMQEIARARYNTSPQQPVANDDGSFGPPEAGKLTIEK